MNPPLPRRLTKCPSRDHLVYHEIIADGLIHSACVVGFEPNEQLCERVAALAWTSGAWLISRDVPAGASMARRLRESLETSAKETGALNSAVGAAIVDAAPLPGLRRYYPKFRS